MCLCYLNCINDKIKASTLSVRKYAIDSLVDASDQLPTALPVSCFPTSWLASQAAIVEVLCMIQMFSPVFHHSGLQLTTVDLLIQRSTASGRITLTRTCSRWKADSCAAMTNSSRLRKKDYQLQSETGKFERSIEQEPRIPLLFTTKYLANKLFAQKKLRLVII